MASIKERSNGFRLFIDYPRFTLVTGDVCIYTCYVHLEELKKQIEEKMIEFKTIQTKRNVAEEL